MQTKFISSLLSTLLIMVRCSFPQRVGAAVMALCARRTAIDLLEHHRAPQHHTHYVFMSYSQDASLGFCLCYHSAHHMISIDSVYMFFKTDFKN